MKTTTPDAVEHTRHLELFEAALRTVPIAMAIIDRDLRYIQVNAACATMTGTPVEAHAGRTLLDVNPLLSPELEQAMRRVIETGEPCLNYRLTRTTLHAPGGVLEIAMHITAFREPNGEIGGICSTATDMTPWRQLQDQFFQAQKLEAVGQLSASIAHDFNNLLTVIGSYCDLVLFDLPEESKYRGDIEEIRGATNRATGLARRMLGTVRNTAIAPTPTDICDTVLAARDLLKHAAGPEVALEIDCDDDTGIVVTDSTQIEQVLMNLVINAAHAMPSGGTVTVRTCHVALTRPLVTRVGEIPAGEYVELSVTDTGTGMDAGTLSRIFEPFFTTKPAGQGTGLGLATVLGITRDVGGGVDVKSVVGSGTTFRILWPRVAETEESHARSAAAKGAARAQASGTLLLVNDEDVLRVGLARILSRDGYLVLEARHGGEAVRVISENATIDLVISDVHMPGVGGYELSERIRAMGRHVPVLFMTNSVGQPGEETGLPSTAEPGDRFLSGPFEVSQLLGTVREMLRPA